MCCKISGFPTLFSFPQEYVFFLFHRATETNEVFTFATDFKDFLVKTQISYRYTIKNSISMPAVLFRWISLCLKGLGHENKLKTFSIKIKGTVLSVHAVKVYKSFR